MFICKNDAAAKARVEHVGRQRAGQDGFRRPSLRLRKTGNSLQLVLLGPRQIPCLAHRFLVAHRIGDRSATGIFIPIEKDARPTVGKHDFVTAGVLSRDFADVFQNANMHVIGLILALAAQACAAG
jgi:hypothetical protein